MTLVMTLFLGVLLPLAFTFVAQVVFPTASHGSLLMKDDKAIGSELLGQEFTAPKYFWGRLSATKPPYNAAASAASNLSMGNALLLEHANERMRHFPVGKKIPVALVTASGSGLDPHISPLAAYFQAARVAKARGIPSGDVQKLIAEYTEKPYLGFIGSERINVLYLNMALDARHGK
jgi:K+-transporting ATPase ATPase C chain